MYEDDPQDLVFDLLGRAIFGSHPLGRPVIGRAEVVAAATREQLAAFHDAPLPPRGDRDRGRRLGRPRRARGPGGGLADSLRAARRRRGRGPRPSASRPRPSRPPRRAWSSCRRTPSSTTCASAPTAWRARTSGASPCGCWKGSSAGPPPRACSRRCASAGAWRTRSSPSPTSTPRPARWGCTSGPAPTTSRGAGGRRGGARAAGRGPRQRGGARALAREPQGPGGARDGVHRGAHEQARELAAARDADPQRERDAGPHRRRRARGPARAGPRAVRARSACRSSGSGPSASTCSRRWSRWRSARARLRTAGPEGERRRSAHDPRGGLRGGGADGQDRLRGRLGRSRHGAGRARRPAARDEPRRSCLGDADVVVDFTTPDVALQNALACVRAGRPRGDRHHRLRPRAAGGCASRGPAAARQRADRAQLRDRGGADDALRRRGGPLHGEGRDHRAAPRRQARRPQRHGRPARPS